MDEDGVVETDEIRRFEDLWAWQRARGLTKDIYRVTRIGSFARDFGLAGQIQRASVSIMSNIAEGHERARPTEFYQFLTIAKASCAEVRSQLYVALDAGHIDQATFDRLRNATEEVSRLVGGLRVSVDKRR
ncbi:MAG: four helix bundle protein [Thermomicrobiales bacterium]